MGYGGLADLPPDQIISKQQTPQILIDQVHFFASQSAGIVLHRAMGREVKTFFSLPATS